MTETETPAPAPADTPVRDVVSKFMEMGYADLESSRGHHIREYDADASAAQWFGAIAADLNMLPLVARQTSQRSGVQITAMESLTLTEAQAVITLKTPEMINSWYAVHSQMPGWPDARAASGQVYCAALGVARGMLGETLRILERVGGADAWRVDR